MKSYEISLLVFFSLLKIAGKMDARRIDTN